MSIEARLIQSYQVAVRNGRHVWITDEPISLGGHDLGPTPHELLMSALAGCKAITCQMYAQRKEWPLTGMTVTVSHKKEKVDTENVDAQLVNQFVCELHFEGDLSAEQIERLHQIADRCPVHKALTGQTTVQSVVRQM